MTERLDIDERGGKYRIGWFDEENDLEGDLCIGETLCHTGPQMSEKDRDEVDEHNFISKTLKTQCAPEGNDERGFYWYDFGDAKHALALAKQLRRQWKDQRKNRPWPDWAKKAAAAGWKPPKTWKPPSE
jgi:hypothetical protein